jgi:hypothetical protein
LKKLPPIDPLKKLEKNPWNGVVGLEARILCLDSL